MLSEVVETAQMVQEVVDAESTQVRYWPTVYCIYRSLDDITTCALKIMGWFGPLDEEYIDEPSDQFSEEWVAGCNESFEYLDQQVKELFRFIFRLSREFNAGLDRAEPEVTFRLRSHFHPKAPWLELAQRDFCSARLSEDSKTLAHVGFRLCPEKRWRISGKDIDEFGLEVRQEVDISQPNARLQLAELIQVEIEKLKAIRDRLGYRMQEGCTIADLLICNECIAI